MNLRRLCLRFSVLLFALGIARATRADASVALPIMCTVGSAGDTADELKCGGARADNGNGDPGNMNDSDQSECVAGVQCNAFDSGSPSSPSDSSTPSQDQNQSTFADPVVGDGEFFTTTTDLSYPGFGINFEFKRSYRSRTKFAGPLGYAWDHSYDQRLYGVAFGKPYCDGSIDLQDGKLGAVRFTPVPTIGAPWSIWRLRWLHKLEAPPGYEAGPAQNDQGLVLRPEGQPDTDDSNIIRWGEPDSRNPDG